MKNTLFFDRDFNFLLLENEENEANSIWIKFHTSAAGSQVLHITANGSTITENLASNSDIVYELEDTNWTNNGATEIWLTNANISSSIIKIIFSEIPEVSCAINRDSNTVFIMQYEGQAEEESGGGLGGSGSAGTSFDFVEIIRNIGFRLLDEPSAVSVEFDEINNRVEIKWTDPADIATNEPAPAEWAGTVVVRKAGSAPLHKWDGTLIVDSTTRDEYSVNPLIDNNVEPNANYYYGIFPYDTKGDYRYTKVVTAFAAEIPAPQINNLSVINTTITVNYSVSTDYTWDYITLVYKKNSAPVNKTDGTAVSLSASSSSVDITELEENATYYFKIFAKVQNTTEELESNMISATIGIQPFTPVGYIESDNSKEQYIDTELYSNAWADVEIKVKFLDLNSGQNAFGCRRYSSAGEYSIARTSVIHTPGWYWTTTGHANTGINDTEWHKIYFEGSSGYAYVDDIYIDSTLPADNVEVYPASFYVFACNDETNGAIYFTSMQLEYLKIWDKDKNLVRDFIPVLNGQGVACLYDNVTHKLYYNKGTGNFNYGNI